MSEKEKMLLLFERLAEELAQFESYCTDVDSYLDVRFVSSNLKQMTSKIQDVRHIVEGNI